MYILMIPSSVNMENKALWLDIVLRYRKRKEGIANWGVGTQQGLRPKQFSNQENDQITRPQKWSEKIFKAEEVKIAPVINVATEMTKKNPREILKNVTGNITSNELQLEAVQGSVMILREPSAQNFEN